MTSVLIAYRKKRINHSLRFGTPISTIRLGWHRSAAIFMSDQVFGYTRWTGNKYGTQDWQLFICKARAVDRLTRIPGVMPGAELLLHTQGTTRTKRALKCIDELESHYGHLAKVSEAYWKHLHNQLEIGWQTRPITTVLTAQ
ncbi:MAG: transposase [Robiginitomaculum sp.]|nr:MAG: transposase [Robiginitomaculum sp.]